jgi:uncharacterized membrane protein YkoI
MPPLRTRKQRLGWRGLDLATATTVAALLCIPVQAQEIDHGGADLARRLLLEGKILPLERIVGRAYDLRHGSLIDAELSYEADHAAYVYELHMLDSSGDVWELEFRADTGELIEHEPIDH